MPGVDCKEAPQCCGSLEAFKLSPKEIEIGKVTTLQNQPPGAGSVEARKIGGAGEESPPHGVSFVRSRAEINGKPCARVTAREGSKNGDVQGRGKRQQGSNIRTGANNSNQ